MYITAATESIVTKSLPFHLIDQIKVKPIVDLIDIPGYNVQKRFRTSFTNSQVEELELAFEKSSFLQQPRRVEIAKRLGLTERQVKVWFSNRRVKGKYKIKPRNASMKSINSERNSYPSVEQTIDILPDVTKPIKVFPSAGYEEMQLTSPIASITTPLSPSQEIVFQTREISPPIANRLPSFQELKSSQANLEVQPQSEIQITPAAQHIQYQSPSIFPPAQTVYPQILPNSEEIVQPPPSDINELLSNIDQLIDQTYEQSSSNMPNNINVSANNLLHATVTSLSSSHRINEKQSQSTADELLNILDEVLLNEGSDELLSVQKSADLRPEPEKLLRIIEDLSSSEV